MINWDYALIPAFAAGSQDFPSSQRVLISDFCLECLGYMSAFYFLSLCLEEIPIGIAYAVWSGVGIVSIAVLSYLIYNQRPDLSAIVGMAFVIVGIVIMRLFSEFPVD